MAHAARGHPRTRNAKTLPYPPGKILLNGFPNPYPNAKNTPREETATGGISQYSSIAYN